ncbi:MAG: efflux RND transporter periplasmic adaptor subunit [Azospirillaceae bacterium]|nr:efflux RND transporter periplasmic adaptor subunit [Azospirillaceae bacterium]
MSIASPMVCRAAAAAVTLLAAILPGGCEQPSAPVAEVRPVRTMTVHAGALAGSASLVGEIRPRYESELGFKISGKIASRAVDVGAIVHKDAVLARLEPQDQINTNREALADLESARATAAEARLQEERQHRLVTSGATSASAYDTAQRVRATAEAQLAAAEAKVRKTRDELGYAVLMAPTDGTITALGAEAGQVVSAGQMVFRFARLDAKDAVFNLAEEQLLSAPQTPVVEVSLLGAPAITTRGTVRETAPSADTVTRTYAVKVALPDAPDSMRFGMSVLGQIHTGNRPVVSIPNAALFQDHGEPAVWLFDPGTATVSLHPVGVLRLERDQTLIDHGLADGAIVVTAGVQYLRPGQKVRQMEVAAAP